jgi:hypothetical protein
MGPGTVQQICPSSQQLVPQQNCVDSQGMGAVHGGSPHSPSLHDSPSLHALPQSPQFLMSFPLFTHVLPQHSQSQLPQPPPLPPAPASPPAAPPLPEAPAAPPRPDAPPIPPLPARSPAPPPDPVSPAPPLPPRPAAPALDDPPFPAPPDAPARPALAPPPPRPESPPPATPPVSGTSLKGVLLLLQAPRSSGVMNAIADLRNTSTPRRG